MFLIDSEKIELRSLGNFWFIAHIKNGILCRKMPLAMQRILGKFRGIGQLRSQEKRFRFTETESTFSA